jgi:hypothetical protein
MKKFVIYSIASAISVCTLAQENTDKGQFSGSFESFNQIYQKDTAIASVLPQDRIGSNNYLKLDYTFKKFSGGIQLESYLPTIAGYPFQLNETKLVNKYFRYTDEKFVITVGDFYEQFGSGLIYRSWENRQIGLNNATEGVNIQAWPVDFLRFKIIYGRQRNEFEYANSNLRGVDAMVDISQIKPREKENPISLQAGFSYVGRHQEYTGPGENFPATVHATSARIDMFTALLSLNIEYTIKSKDPGLDNLYSETKGQALLLNAGIAAQNLGINLSFRSLNTMFFRGEREATGIALPVNYIPALTKQHEFLTTNIYVYNPQPMGEIGGQADIFFNLGNYNPKQGKYGSKVAINFSWFGGSENPTGLFSYTRDYFRDASIEWKKKWNNQWGTMLQAQYLFYNKSVIEGGLYENITANTIVLNTTYKYNKTKSLRFELQHLYTKKDMGNWAASLLEFNIAPKWSFFISDLYNYGKSNLHYPNIGGVFTKGAHRLGLSYGRQRAGMVCNGGVCRYVPASTGLTITLASTFK